MAPAHMTRPLTYTLTVVLMVGLLSPLLSLWVAQRAAEKAVTTAQQTAAAQTEQARRRYCDLLEALLNVYIDAPPETDTGKAVQKEYLVQYNVNQCQPPRLK